MRSRRWLRIGSIALGLLGSWLAGTFGLAGPSPGTVPLEITVHARALAPGEPVRVIARAPAPLETLHGEFLGARISMIRTRPSAEDGPETWSGWAMIDLDQASGPAAVEMSGATTDKREARGTLAVVVQAKEFPTEELKVAPQYVTPPPEVQSRLERERAKLAKVYRSRTSFAPPESPFAPPVPGEPTSVFGTRRLFNGKPRSPHPGLDLRAPEGTPVQASGGGRVAVAQDLYYSGNTVILDHGGGLFTLYAHLSFIQVSEGSEVERGQVIGLSGATGRVTGPHLHWGAKIGNRPFDPTALLDPALYR